MSTITLVHQAALGDTILLLPLIRSLRARFAPEPVSLTLVTRTNLGQMFTMLGLIEAYASADDPGHSRWFAPPDDRPGAAPAWARADWLISAVAGPEDPWAQHARLARQGLAPETLQFFHPRAPAEYPGHVTDWHREQLAAMRLPEAPLPLERANPDGAVLIHPGAGGDAKCWPRERFVEVGRVLKRNGIVPTFLLGEAEQERWGRSLIGEMQGEFPWYLHMGLFELAERMGRARVFLGNDSGVTHLAAALGIPTIALFGPSNDVQWRPVGPSVRVLRAPVPEERNLEALETASVLDAVFAELRKL